MPGEMPLHSRNLRNRPVWGHRNVEELIQIGVSLKRNHTTNGCCSEQNNVYDQLLTTYLKWVFYDVHTAYDVQGCTHDIKDQRKDARWCHWFEFDSLTCWNPNPSECWKIRASTSALCWYVLPGPGTCSIWPFAMPLSCSTSSKVRIWGGWSFSSSWTSVNVTCRAGPPLWLYCCLSFWMVLSVTCHQDKHIRINQRAAFVCREAPRGSYVGITLFGE